MRLDLETVLGRLRRVPWESAGVEWVVLFGSLPRRKGAARDIDLLVRAPRGSVLDLILLVSERAGVDPGIVDVVDAESAPCTIVRDAWRTGIVVWERHPGVARAWLLVRVKICYDYEIMSRKLRVRERALRAIRRRWGAG